MRYTAFSFILIACLSCKSITITCRQLAFAQYSRACELYGSENVELWRLKNVSSNAPYAYHLQVFVRGKGWLDNQPITYMFSSHHNSGCRKLIKELP